LAGGQPKSTLLNTNTPLIIQGACISSCPFPPTLKLRVLLISIAAVHAQLTPSGILEIYLKAREAADAPVQQKVTLYLKSKALVIGMDHYDAGWPQLSNGIKDAEEVANALTAQGFEVTLKKDLGSDLDRTFKNFFIVQGDDPDARLLLWFAGHGETINGEAYLVPVDAPLPTKGPVGAPRQHPRAVGRERD
jgi:hypothetical protein